MSNPPLEPRSFPAILRTYLCILAMLRNDAAYRLGHATAETYYQRLLVYTNMILAPIGHTVALYQPALPPRLASPLSREGRRSLRMIAKHLLFLSTREISQRYKDTYLDAELSRAKTHTYSILFLMTERQ